MATGYSSFCDDFFLDMYVNNRLDLPAERHTILTFFERVQKSFPSMASFHRRGNNEFWLEEDRNTGQYRWVVLEKDRVGSGIVNPSTFDDAYGQHRLILELLPYMLSVSHLDIDSLDVTFAMDFDCAGSHDEVIAEAYFGATAFGRLLDLPSARPIALSPVLVIALSDDCRTQARVNIESKTSIYEPRRERQGSDEPISLSFTIRQYPSNTEPFDTLESFENQCRLAEELMAERIFPYFVQPLTGVIAQKRVT